MGNRSTRIRRRFAGHRDDLRQLCGAEIPGGAWTGGIGEHRFETSTQGRFRIVCGFRRLEGSGGLMPALTPKSHGRTAYPKLFGYPFVACALGSRSNGSGSTHKPLGTPLAAYQTLQKQALSIA